METNKDDNQPPPEKIVKLAVKNESPEVNSKETNKDNNQTPPEKILKLALKNKSPEVNISQETYSKISGVVNKFFSKDRRNENNQDSSVINSNMIPAQEVGSIPHEKDICFKIMGETITIHFGDAPRIPGVPRLNIMLFNKGEEPIREGCRYFDIQPPPPDFRPSHNFPRRRLDAVNPTCSKNMNPKRYRVLTIKELADMGFVVPPAQGGSIENPQPGPSNIDNSVAVRRSPAQIKLPDIAVETPRRVLRSSSKKVAMVTEQKTGPSTAKASPKNEKGNLKKRKSPESKYKIKANVESKKRTKSTAKASPKNKKIERKKNEKQSQKMAAKSEYKKQTRAKKNKRK